MATHKFRDGVDWAVYLRHRMEFADRLRAHARQLNEQADVIEFEIMRLNEQIEPIEKDGPREA